LRELGSSSISINPQTCYHASLAMSVAAWDAYLNAIVLEFFSTVANPIDVPFHSLHTICRDFGDEPSSGSTRLTLKTLGR
jgi:hypothetical protein